MKLTDKQISITHSGVVIGFPDGFLHHVKRGTKGIIVYFSSEDIETDKQGFFAQSIVSLPYLNQKSLFYCFKDGKIYLAWNNQLGMPMGPIKY